MQSMTNDDKTYIQQLFDGLKAYLEKSIQSLREMFDTKYNYQAEQQTRLREDIIDLYKKTNNNENKITELRTDIINHKSNHAEGNTNKRQWVGMVISSIFALIVGIIMYFIGRG